MKKLVLLAAIGLASCVSSFGQGFFNFANSATTAVWDDFTTPGTGVKSSGNTWVAILWSANTAVNPLVGTTGTPANSATSSVPNISWNNVLNDPNYHLATSGGVNLTATNRTGITAGTFSGGVVGIDGTAVGDTIRMYVVSWRFVDGPGAVSNPNNGYLGFSNPFNILLSSSGGTPSSLAAAGQQAFGVYAVPEPSTFALAGLGAAAMLIFRRRK